MAHSHEYLSAELTGNQVISRRETLGILAGAGIALFLDPLDVIASGKPPKSTLKPEEILKHLNREPVEFQDGRAIVPTASPTWKQFSNLYRHNDVSGNVLTIGLGKLYEPFMYGESHSEVDSLYRFTHTPIPEPARFSNTGITHIKYQVGQETPRVPIDTEGNVVLFVGHPSFAYDRQDLPDNSTLCKTTQTITANPSDIKAQYIAQVFGNSELFYYGLVHQNSREELYLKYHIVLEKDWGFNLDFVSYRWGMLCDRKGRAVDMSGTLTDQPLYTPQYFYSVQK